MYIREMRWFDTCTHHAVFELLKCVVCLLKYFVFLPQYLSKSFCFLDRSVIIVLCVHSGDKVTAGPLAPA